MQHLAIRINGQYVSIPEDFAVDFEDVNPLFNEYESFAANIELPIETNRSILFNADSITGDYRIFSLEGLPIDIYVDGNVFRSGKVYTSDGEIIDDKITVELRSDYHSIEQSIEDLNCRDIPVKDKIQIGEKLGDIELHCYYTASINVEFELPEEKDASQTVYTEDLGDFSFKGFAHPNALGFSTPNITIADESIIPYKEKDFINVTKDYTGSPYCNARVCYKHYAKADDGTSSSVLETKGDYDPYYVLEADRQQSGICFYLLYFLDCLFNYLGIEYDNSNLTAVGDMNKLCFFTTHCKYDEERKNETPGYDLSTQTKINLWLFRRKTYGGVSFDYPRKRQLNSITYKFDDSASEKTYKVGEYDNDTGLKVQDIYYEFTDVNTVMGANIMNMYANSDNFPDMSVKSVLDSLWAGWGIKFIVDRDKENFIKPFFIRDIFRDKSEPILLDVELISIYKMSEKISGIRMKYSSESESKKQKQNIKEGKRDYDTNFDYIDYRNVNSTKRYVDIIKTQSVSDMTCYITPNTGNAYRIKVDKDAATIGEMHPSVFEVGGFKGAEIGDCTEKMKDFVEELIIDLTPTIMTDVNGKRERLVSEQTTKTSSGGTITGANLDEKNQKLAVFVDEDMWHENIDVSLLHPVSDDKMEASIEFNIHTDECYDPSKTDDGDSPLQHYDWGSSISMMRGGGADMQIQEYDFNYDNCGNYKWRTTAGDYTMNPDSIDNWGNDYDYNGTNEGIGDDERFSLKIQAYKEVDGKILCNADEMDEYGNITRKVLSRGLKDSFMAEYIHWKINRKLAEIKFRCELSKIQNIQWYKRYRIGDYIFFFNKLNYSISAGKGIGVVTAQIYI